ncbi:hypothetical protein [Gordonia amarae]|uniref:hypothetical protein n=1 Tax=Gordonia amarae TaxID=36821 RepID=UPI001AF8CD42|nr:hypothetical protein [Gordonia amarae]QHN22105.1 hypothetical protein GII34_11645 [Gordonia amarae]QHN30986.1 hypothetical protein GII32_11820 [Gordonia amarae]
MSPTTSETCRTSRAPRSRSRRIATAVVAAAAATGLIGTGQAQAAPKTVTVRPALQFGFDSFAPGYRAITSSTVTYDKTAGYVKVVIRHRAALPGNVSQSESADLPMLSTAQTFQRGTSPHAITVGGDWVPGKKATGRYCVTDDFGAEDCGPVTLSRRGSTVTMIARGPQLKNQPARYLSVDSRDPAGCESSCPPAGKISERRVNLG